MLTIKPETADLLDQIRHINDAAFDQPAEGMLVDALRQGESFIPALSLVAEVDGKAVGHSLFSKIKIKGETATADALALAPMSVLPEHQNQGIGSKLVAQGLEACWRLGHRVVVVLGHPDFYPRFGFRPASLYGIRPPFQVRDEVFMVCGRDDGSLSGIAGMVVYPPAFDTV